MGLQWHPGRPRPHQAPPPHMTTKTCLRPTMNSPVEITVVWPSGSSTTLLASPPTPTAIRGWTHAGFTGTYFVSYADNNTCTLYRPGASYVAIFTGYIPVFQKVMLHPTTFEVICHGWNPQ